MLPEKSSEDQRLALCRHHFQWLCDPHKHREPNISISYQRERHAGGAHRHQTAALDQRSLR